jgi:hypothetical protein
MSPVQSTLNPSNLFSLGNHGIELNEILANYTGDLSACLANCSNHGFCKFDSVMNKYMCQCDQYRMGRACQTDSRPCSSNPCLNNGTCSNMNNDTSFECTCQDSNLFYGIYCENNLDLCQINNTNVCVSLSQGYCIMNGSQPMCKCLMGYSGVNCEVISTFVIIRKYIVDSSTIITIIVLIGFILTVLFFDYTKYFVMNKPLKKKPRIKRFKYNP